MSGHCDFCDVWHSGSCFHPGRAILSALRKENEALQRAVLEIIEQCYSDKFDVVIKAGLMPYTMKYARALLAKEGETK